MSGIKTPVKDRQLTVPQNFRIYDYQEAFLDELAEEQGHGKKVLALRKLIDDTIVAKNGKRRNS